MLELDQDGYPTPETLRIITEWPFKTFSDYDRLLEEIEQVWRWHDYFKRGPLRKPRFPGAKDRRRTWKVSTGGWSGHEDMIAALQDNHMFWAICWLSSRRGGHYEFETREDAKTA